MRLRWLNVLLLVAAIFVMWARPAAACHHHGLPHGVCVTVTLNPLTPPPTYEVCVPLPPI